MHCYVPPLAATDSHQSGSWSLCHIYLHTINWIASVNLAAVVIQLVCGEAPTVQTIETFEVF